MITEITIANVIKGVSGLNSLITIPVSGSVKNDTTAALSIASIYLLYASATAKVVKIPVKPIKLSTQKKNGICIYLPMPSM